MVQAAGQSQAKQASAEEEEERYFTWFSGPAVTLPLAASAASAAPEMNNSIIGFNETQGVNLIRTNLEMQDWLSCQIPTKNMASLVFQVKSMTNECRLLKRNGESDQDAGAAEDSKNDS